MGKKAFLNNLVRDMIRVGCVEVKAGKHRKLNYFYTDENGVEKKLVFTIPISPKGDRRTKLNILQQIKRKMLDAGLDQELIPQTALSLSPGVFTDLGSVIILTPTIKIILGGTMSKEIKQDLRKYTIYSVLSI